MARKTKIKLYAVIGVALLAAAIYWDKVILAVDKEQFITSGWWYLTFFVFAILVFLATPVVVIGLVIWLFSRAAIRKWVLRVPDDVILPRRPLLWSLAVILIGLFLTAMALLTWTFPWTF